MSKLKTQKVGITECGDPVFSDSWIPWCKEGFPAILITKDPGKLWQILDKEFPNQPPNIIVHGTITGWGGTKMEPNVPGITPSLLALQSLIQMLKNPDRVVLRIDPIILTAEGVLRAWEVKRNAEVMNLTHRMIISFADMYPHVKKRFSRNGLQIPHDSFHAPLELRNKMWKAMSDGIFSPNICGEPDMPCIGCVSKWDCEILGVEPMANLNPQRKGCECCGNKKQLLTDRMRCFHNCQYCYWKD